MDQKLLERLRGSKVPVAVFKFLNLRSVMRTYPFDVITYENAYYEKLNQESIGYQQLGEYLGLIGSQHTVHRKYVGCRLYKCKETGSMVTLVVDRGEKLVVFRFCGFKEDNSPDKILRWYQIYDARDISNIRILEDDRACKVIFDKALIGQMIHLFRDASVANNLRKESYNKNREICIEVKLANGEMLEFTYHAKSRYIKRFGICYLINILDLNEIK